MVKIIKSFLKKNRLTRRMVQNYRTNKYRKTAKHYYNTETRQEKTIVFSAYMAKSYACSPRVIYEYMINDSFFDDYTFIWVFKRKNIQIFDDIPNLKRSKIVVYLSKEYFQAMYQAKYWINNSRVKDYILKHDDQIYIQTWHGTPYKKIGADISAVGVNAKFSNSELADVYMEDAKKYNFMPSPSKYYTRKITSAFSLEKINKDNILVETGYPRNDFITCYKEEDVKKIMEELNIPIDKKIILYAPTWRDNMYDPKIGYISEFSMDFEKLKNSISDEYVIIFKPHYFISNDFDFHKYEGFVYNGNLIQDISDLYIISDILITDYSSVFFDYALLNRKIIFYMYDYDFYKNDVRDFYLDDEQLPGEIIKNEESLINSIKNTKDNYVDHSEFNDIYNTYEDGNSAKRLIDLIFKQENTQL